MKNTYTFKLGEDAAKANTLARVSTRAAQFLCKQLNKKKFVDVKKVLSGLVDGTKNIEGKFYTSTSKSMLDLLNSVEHNARAEGFTPEEMMVMISAHAGPKMLRGRRKRAFGLRIKATHLHAVLVGGKKKSKDEKKSKKEKNPDEKKSEVVDKKVKVVGDKKTPVAKETKKKTEKVEDNKGETV